MLRLGRMLELAPQEGEQAVPAKRPVAALAQWIEPSAMGSQCLLIGAVSSLPSHYAALTPQARRHKAYQNGQGTTAKSLFRTPACSHAGSRRDIRGCKLKVTALSPPKLLSPKHHCRHGTAAGRSLSAGSRSKKGEEICIQAYLGGLSCYQALVARQGPTPKPHLEDGVPRGSPSRRRGSPSQATVAGRGLTPG